MAIEEVVIVEEVGGVEIRRVDKLLLIGRSHQVYDRAQYQVLWSMWRIIGGYQVPGTTATT